MRKFLPLLLLGLCGVAGAQNCTQFPNSMACLNKITTPAGTDMIMDDQGPGTLYDPGTVTLSKLQNYVLGPSGIWNGQTIGVIGGGTGAQNLIGPIKGNGASPFSTALSADITGLWSGSCSSSTYLRGDGLCAAPSGTGTVTSSASPVSGNVAAFTTATNIAPAVASNVTGLWSGTCDLTTYLRGDGACATPAGNGTVTNATTPSWLTVTGGGTATLNFAATAGLTGNQFLATPAGVAGAIALRSILAGDLPLISLTSGVSGILPAANMAAVPLATGVSGVLPAANGGSGVANSTTLTWDRASVFSGSTTGNIGYKEEPPSATGTPCLNINYTAVLADSGHLLCNSSATAITFTIPANAAVAYPIGSHLFFLNPCALGIVTIAINSDTMYLSPSGTHTSFSLAACGNAEAFKYGTATWMIWGSGLTGT